MPSRIIKHPTHEDSQGIKPRGVEQNLDKSLHVFKTIFANCSEAIVILDPYESCILTLNDHACRLLGFDPDTAFSVNFAAIPSDQEQAFRQLFEQVQNDGEGRSNKLFLETVEGERLSVEMSAWAIEIERQVYLLAFVRENVFRNRTEKALWESEQRFGTLINNMQEGVMIVDNSDVVQFANRRIFEMLGYTEGDLIGKVGYELLFTESGRETIREKNRLRTQKIADQYEIEMRRKGGEPIWVKISGVPIIDSSGRVKGSFGIITDITESKRSEEALREAHAELELRVKERTAELLNSNDSLKRQIAEKNLLEEERQKFVSLVENSNDVILMALPDGHLIYANEAAHEILKIDKDDDISTKRISDFHPPDLKGFIYETLIPTVINEGMWTGEIPLLNLLENRLRPTLINAFTVRHPKTGSLIAVATIYRDITERKQTEEALQRTKDGLEVRVDERTAELTKANRILRHQILERERAEEQLHDSENRYRMLFNSGNDAIFVHHLNDKYEVMDFIEVNDVACQKLGYSRKELLKLSPRSISVQLDGILLDEQINRLIRDKHIIYEDEFMTKTGIRTPVEISAHLFELNDRLTIMSIARDTTARKRAENQIREQAALLDKAQDAILVCDLNDHIIYWNKSAERLYGWKTEEAIGNNVYDMLFHSNTQQFIAARRTVLNEYEWQGELRQVTKEGRSIVVESRWTLVHDNKDEAKSILVVNTDITEKKKIEAQFLRAQRMESIGALAGGIAHDLNNVLAPILTAVQILEVRFTDEKSQRILQTVESNVKRGADMVKQILTFARGVEGERIPIQLPHLIVDLEKIVLETFPKSIHIKVDVKPGLWTVAGDPTQLHQVLLNLCVNARDAMPQGGNLLVQAENVVLDEAFVRSHLEAKVGSYVRIKVVDSGIGISDDIITKIFEPFFTTKAPGKGTGLGLSTVIAIVKSHGGFINVSSDEVHGTVFDVYVPAEADLEPVEYEPEEPAVTNGNGELILIVDDETSILEITRETLETYGYSVMIARDGAEAVGMYAQYKNDIQVVITDMMMPVMDGGATIDAIRKIKNNVKIIASSGFMEDAKVSEMVGKEADAFLHKPYTAEKLLDVIRTVLSAN